MRANSRSSIRWRVRAVATLALCILPSAALGDGGGNGNQVAAKVSAPVAVDAATDERKGLILIDQDLGSAGDGIWIGDDSDVASVEGSANDDPAGAVDELSDGSF